MLLVLSLAYVLNGIVLKQQFNELINGKSQTNRDQKSNSFFFRKQLYFCNDVINMGEFNSNLLKVDKKSYKDTDIYYIRYKTIKKIGDCKNNYSVNPLYQIIGHVEENNGNG